MAALIRDAGQEEQFAQLNFAADENDELLLQLQFGENVAWSAVRNARQIKISWAEPKRAKDACQPLFEHLCIECKRSDDLILNIQYEPSSVELS